MSSSVNCNLLLYADDSALFTSGKDPKVISETLSKELGSCRQWLIENKLFLHLGKTESILLELKLDLAGQKKLKSLVMVTLLIKLPLSNTSGKLLMKIFNT